MLLNVALRLLLFGRVCSQGTCDVCCNLMQAVAVRLQCVAVRYSAWHCNAARCCALLCVAACCSVVWYIVMCVSHVRGVASVIAQCAYDVCRSASLSHSHAHTNIPILFRTHTRTHSRKHARTHTHVHTHIRTLAYAHSHSLSHTHIQAGD